MSMIVSWVKHIGASTTLVLACLVAMSVATLAQAPKKTVKPNQPHGHTHSGARKEVAPQRSLAIPDLDVRDQEGHKRRFYTDFLKDKVVVVNFIFTTCRGFCPLAGANFSKLQTLLGARLGRDVHLISVTTDPETDTPEKLKTWAAQFQAKDGWTLVTGKKAEIEQLLRVLTGDGLNNGYHVPSIFIANDRKKAHRFAYGLDSPERLLKMVEEVNR